jgi:signal transduction histidine kinase
MMFEDSFNKSKIKLSYVFIVLAIILMGISITIFIKYSYVEQKIIDTNLNSDIRYVDDITTNFKKLIQKEIDGDFYTTLKKDREKIKKLESYLQLFITKRYKYIYVVDKIWHKTNEFRFLLDGSINKNEKSEFGESYEPLEIDKWNEAYKNKKAIYFFHKNLKSLWITYLKPIVENGVVKAMIVVDFSMQEHNAIVDTLKGLDDIYKLALLFSIVIFIIMILFSYIDFKREKEKDMALKHVENVNKNLEEKIAQAVEENRQKDQAMFQQSRLAQMGEMISMIAHQWRQPLSAISSTASAISLKAELNKLDNDKAIELSDKICNFSQHLSSTIDDFRNFFKSNKDKNSINYSQIVEAVLDIIEISLKNKNIELIKELKCDENFDSYKNELKQVILNLIKNAEDALVEKRVENPYIKISTFKKGNDFVLEISDNAGGVPEDIVDKIFDPYFSTKTKRDGTGLGLYMSKIIIEEHCGGKIEVYNDKMGAVFRIVLGDDSV